MTSRSRSRSSSRSSGAPELPRVFVDRSLGSEVVPSGLRAVGFEVVTMPDRYTEAGAQRLDDVDWIPDVSGDGLVIFSKDSGLKTDPERAAIVACEARVFLVPDTQSPAKVMIERYVVNRYRIAQRSKKPGPYIYIARPDRLEKVKLD